MSAAVIAPSANRTQEQDLRGRIDRFGIIGLTAAALLTLLSPFLAGGIDVTEGHTAAAPRWIHCAWCSNFATDANPFRRPGLLALGISLPLLISTAVFVGLWFLLRRYRSAITPEILDRLQRWSIFFALASSLALPVMTRDFWLSIMWGRMAVHGINPYYVHATPAVMEHIPVFDQLATYGPLWILISAVIAGAGFGVVWIEFVLFKLVLGAAWFGSFRLIRAITATQSLQVQAASIAMFGWIPLVFHQTLSEGHNDIVMVFLCLCALRAMQQGTRSSTLLMVASASVKYVTAPLLLLDLLHNVFTGRFRSYVIRLAVACIVGVSIFAVFYRSPAFFAPAADMRSWRFMEPSSIVSVLIPWLGESIVGLMSKAIRAAFLVLTVFYIVRYVQRRTSEALHEAAFAIVALVLFVGTGHVWPWFLIWLVALGALVPATILGRWITGVVVTFPFAQIWWKFDNKVLGGLHPELSYFWPAFLVYGISMLWLWKASSVSADAKSPAEVS